MVDFIQTMFWPFTACLLLVGIHVYLGIHVLARQVIFADLALAQIAAFGSVFGILIGVESQISALFLAIMGAIFLTFLQTEAFIGILYAIALSATILASSHLPHGADELRELFSGSILWALPEKLMKTAVLYVVIALIHWFFRKQFFKASFEPDSRRRIWDFLFYVSFACVVTSSVSIAGVLLVFCYLVIPAVNAMLFVRSISNRLWLGWGIGVAVSMLGLGVSYEFDLPSGPTIVLCFGACLLGSYVLSRKIV